MRASGWNEIGKPDYDRVHSKHFTLKPTWANILVLFQTEIGITHTDAQWAILPKSWYKKSLSERQIIKLVFQESDRFLERLEVIDTGKELLDIEVRPPRMIFPLLPQ